MKVYFVRHGETEANALSKSQGANEPLSERGKEQVKRISERFIHLPIDKLLTSPHLRTIKTAEEIARVTGKIPEPIELLREFAWPSAWIGMSRQDPAISAYRKQIEQNWTSAPTTKLFDEETFAEISERARQTLEMLAALHTTTNTVAVVSHSRFLKVILAIILCGPSVDGATASHLVYHLSLNNTGLTVADYDPARPNHWNLITINDHAHLGDYQRQQS